MPLRACNNANANGGLVYANANNASSNSNTNSGSRLTLRANYVAEMPNYIATLQCL
nr:MAG TPA: hypothetical protein [Caudoviricetes sp.]